MTVHQKFIGEREGLPDVAIGEVTDSGLAASYDMIYSPYLFLRGIICTNARCVDTSQTTVRADCC